jgi:hypothetical protein
MKGKYAIYIGLFKRFAAPVIIGGLVVWLMHNGLDNWASIVCDISANLGIFVSECK